MTSEDILKKFTQEYQATLPEKVSSIRQILDAMKQKIDLENLKALRLIIHKIAGSAGTYGYASVSKLCQEFEKDLLNKIDHFQEIPGSPNWLIDFEKYFDGIKEGFSQ